MTAIPVLNLEQWVERELWEGHFWVAEDVEKGTHDMEYPIAGVYFIQAGEDWDNPVKIGYSLNVGKRFDDLQCAHYEELYIRLVCRVQDVSRLPHLEQWFHRMWAGRCMRGEWFMPDQAMKHWFGFPLTEGHIVAGFEGVPNDVIARSQRIRREQDETRIGTKLRWEF